MSQRSVIIENLEQATKWCRENQANLEWGPWGGIDAGADAGKYKWVCYHWISAVGDETTGVGNTPEEAVNSIIKQEEEPTKHATDKK